MAFELSRALNDLALEEVIPRLRLLFVDHVAVYARISRTSDMLGLRLGIQDRWPRLCRRLDRRKG
jgi:hypothetical protein